jgi:tRNA threonylcarbamoyladenosine biosynthesis protein TsaE
MGGRMSEEWTCWLSDAVATENFGRHLASTPVPGCFVALTGQLGAGKTTLVRSYLRGLGYHGPVPSPSYALLQVDDQQSPLVYHLDLYRLQSPSEVHELGVTELFNDRSVVWIEWPAHGEGVLPEPDCAIEIVWHDDGRKLTMRAQSDNGRKMLQIGRGWCSA